MQVETFPPRVAVAVSGTPHTVINSWIDRGIVKLESAKTRQGSGRRFTNRDILQICTIHELTKVLGMKTHRAKDFWTLLSGRFAEYLQGAHIDGCYLVLKYGGAKKFDIEQFDIPGIYGDYPRILSEARDQGFHTIQIFDVSAWLLDVMRKLDAARRSTEDGGEVTQ